MIKFFTSLLFLAISANFGSVHAVDEVGYPATRLGWMAYDGSLDIWLAPEDWHISTADISLPLRMRYSSSLKQVPGSGVLLGRNWWLPLLESCVVASDELNATIYTIWGGHEYLSLGERSKNGEQSIRSRNGVWSGTVNSAARKIEIDGPMSLTFEYIGGKLAKIRKKQSPAFVKFIRDSQGRLTDLNDSLDKSLIKVAYDEATDLAKQIKLNSKILDLKEINFPVLERSRLTGGAPVLTNVEPILGEIAIGGVEIFSMDTNYSSDELEYLVRSPLVVPSNLGEMKFVCDSVDGLLKRDNTSSYNYMRDDSVVRIERIPNESDRSEFYEYNERNLIEKRGGLDGSVATKTFVGAAGPLYGLLSSGSVDLPGSSSKSGVRHYYDKSGNLFTSRYTNGATQAYKKTAEGVIKETSYPGGHVDKEVYSEKGLLLAREMAHGVTNYVYSDSSEFLPLKNALVDLLARMGRKCDLSTGVTFLLNRNKGDKLAFDVLDFVDATGKSVIPIMPKYSELFPTPNNNN